MYLILSGAVRIGRQVPGMGEEALAVLRAGTHFGEMALIDDFPRSADARAHEACRLFVVRKEDMEDLLFVDRDLAYDLLWSLRPHAVVAAARDERQDDLHGRHLEALVATHQSLCRRRRSRTDRDPRTELPCRSGTSPHR